MRLARRQGGEGGDEVLGIEQGQQRILHDMDDFQPHPRTKMRGHVIVRLGEGLTLQKTADESSIHLSIVEHRGHISANWPGRVVPRTSPRTPKNVPRERKVFGELMDVEGDRQRIVASY